MRLRALGALAALVLLVGCEPTDSADLGAASDGATVDGGCVGAGCTCPAPCSPGQGCCGGVCTPLNTALSCGACDKPCPGADQASGAATCTDPTRGACEFSCRGENYDVDADPKNGCERADTAPPNHSQPTAINRGHKGCNDTDSTDSFTGTMLSDGRTHSDPPVTALGSLYGAAPDFFVVYADGGLGCVDDYQVTLETSGGGPVRCYQLTIVTDKKTESILVTGTGTATMSSGSASYGDGSTIYLKIEKVCTLPVQEAVTYKVSYHL